MINLPVRVVIKGLTSFGQRTFDFFSLHWPVHGTIRFKLPAGETVSIYSRGDDFVSTQAFWKGFTGYEGPSINVFYHLSRKSRVVFDIGANVGYFSLIAAAANKQAKVYSFEPIKYVFDRLRRNIGINGFDNIIAVNSIVGDSNDPVSFYAPQIDGISHAGSTKKGWAEGTTEIKVESVTGDSYKGLKNTGKVDLLKMDCEFHEVEVLNGMTDILEQDKPIILMEILFPEGKEQSGHFENDQYKEIERIIKKNNYYIYLISNSGLVRMEDLEYNPEHRNYLFSPKRSSLVYLSYSDMDKLVSQIT